MRRRADLRPRRRPPPDGRARGQLPRPRRPDVQGFVGSLVGLGAAKGVFVTTSTFSAQAREFTKHLAQRVILIDGATLADLMIEYGVGVRTTQTLTLRRLDEDFFADAD